MVQPDNWMTLTPDVVQDIHKDPGLSECELEHLVLAGIVLFAVSSNTFKFFRLDVGLRCPGGRDYSRQRPWCLGDKEKRECRCYCRGSL